jgi:hypothetical protein
LHQQKEAAMKCVLSAFLLLAFIGPAQADACDDLISTLESALAAPSTPAPMQQQLQELLRLGRGAKAAGNVQACERVNNGELNSQPNIPNRPPGYKCEKTPETV